MIPLEERPSNPCSRWSSACLHFLCLPVSYTRTPMPTGPHRRSELPPCSWRQTCAFAFCMAGVSGRVVMVSVTGFGRGRPSVRPQAAPCLCGRVWARSPNGEAAGRTVPLSLRLPSRTESRGAAQRSSVFWKAQLTISRRAACSRTCAACVSDLAPREQALRGQGTREVNARSAEGLEPLPRSPAFCAGCGAHHDNAWDASLRGGNPASGLPLPIAWRDFPVRCRLAIDCVPSPAWFDLSQGSKGCNSSDSFLRR